MLFAFHRSIHDSLRNPRRNTLVLQFVVFCLRFRWSQVLFCAALLDLTSGIKERELPHQHVRIDIFSWSALVASAVYRHANVSADVCQCSARMRCCVLRRFSVENQSFSNWLGTIVPFLWNQFFAHFFGTSRPLVLTLVCKTPDTWGERVFRKSFEIAAGTWCTTLHSTGMSNAQSAGRKSFLHELSGCFNENDRLLNRCSAW
jgi:hypothetical protein